MIIFVVVSAADYIDFGKTSAKATRLEGMAAFS
jgi:hypothetical protein